MGGGWVGVSRICFVELLSIFLVLNTTFLHKFQWITRPMYIARLDLAWETSNIFSFPCALGYCSHIHLLVPLTTSIHLHNSCRCVDRRWHWHFYMMSQYRILQYSPHNYAHSVGQSSLPTAASSFTGKYPQLETDNKSQSLSNQLFRNGNCSNGPKIESQWQIANMVLLIWMFTSEHAPTTWRHTQILQLLQSSCFGRLFQNEDGNKKETWQSGLDTFLTL